MFLLADAAAWAAIGQNPRFKAHINDLIAQVTADPSVAPQLQQLRSFRISISFGTAGLRTLDRST